MRVRKICLLKRLGRGRSKVKCLQLKPVKWYLQGPFSLSICAKSGPGASLVFKVKAKECEQLCHKMLTQGSVCGTGIAMSRPYRRKFTRNLLLALPPPAFFVGYS